jgi:hypothetical protein
MSQNIDHLDPRQDDDAFPIDTYTSDDDTAMYAAWLDRQRATADTAIANAAELTKLVAVTATCRPVPVKMLGDFEGVFDKPVRPTIAARVADHVASL